ncbi:MAG: hypothetical protein HYX26_08900 [Acidobacteriales bacterium]|nr:hypothetical protein [Terriglobales bacterium]
MSRRLRIPLFLFAVLALAVSVSAQAKKRSPRKSAPKAAAARVKVAEGKYELRDKGVAPERSFVESWELFKTGLGYDLVEQWHVGAGGGAPPSVIDVAIEFARGLHTVKMRIGTLEDRSLTCELALSEFICRGQGNETRVPMTGVYDFFSPSPWALGSIIRRAGRKPDEVTSVQLVRMAGMTPSGPRLSTFQAEVQYIGDDQIEIEGRHSAASIFEVRAPGSIPSMMIWVDADGIVLALQDSTRQDQRMELTEYKKLARF